MEWIMRTKHGHIGCTALGQYLFAVGALHLGAEVVGLVVTYPEGQRVTPAFSSEAMSVYAGEAWLVARVRVRDDAGEGTGPDVLLG